jgi:hypothetical protein
VGCARSVQADFRGVLIVTFSMLCTNYICCEGYYLNIPVEAYAL